jgi:hypothetical protein
VTVVTIQANPAPTGQTFLKWTGATVASATSASTTLTMPAAATSVTASYAVNPSSVIPLTVNGGSGSGSYTPGTVLTITASAPPAGLVFDQWVGIPVKNPTSLTTTVIAPATEGTINATYRLVGTPVAVLTVVNGTGGGTYVSNTSVVLTANPPPAGYIFSTSCRLHI